MLEELNMSGLSAYNIIENARLIYSWKLICDERAVWTLTRVAWVQNFHIRVELRKLHEGFRYVAGSLQAPLTLVSKLQQLAFKAFMPDFNEQ